VFLFDEVRRWPAGLLDMLTECGVLKELGPADSVACDSCPDNHWINVDICEYPTGTIGMGKCPECGRIQVPLDRLRQWRFNFGGLAEVVARSIGINGESTTDVHDRVIFIGTTTLNGSSREVFVTRGLYGPDGSDIIARAERLRAARRPVVFVPSRMPGESFWEERPSSPVCLLEIVSLEGATIHVDAVAFAERVALPELGRIGKASNETLVLTDVELNVLQAMSVRPHQSMLQVDIQTAAGYSKSTTRDAIKRLRELDFVSQPPGKKRKGLAITTSGEAFLAGEGERAQAAVGAKP